MQLTGEQINDFLAKAVLDSQIGEVVKGAVARAVADLSKSYNNPFDHVIKHEVEKLIQAEVETTYRPILEARVKESMAQLVTDDVISTILKSATERLSRNY